jgi:hypothetical protein
MTAPTSAAQTTVAAASNPPSLAQQAATSWLQQMMNAPANGSALATAPSIIPNLPASIPAYAQSFAAASHQAAQPNSASSLPSAQQAAASWLQQIGAANGTNAASFTTPPSNTSGLPAGVPGYAQSSGSQPAGTLANATGASSGAAQSASALLQQIIAASTRAGGSVTTTAAPGTSSNLPPGVASYAQPPTSQPVAAANTGPWTVNAPASTILAANDTQSIAAMFGVPAFPAALAYAAPDSKSTATPSTAGSSQSWTKGAAAAPAAPNATANTLSLPGDLQAANAQSQPSAATQNPTSPRSTASDKAAVLAQAAQESVRQGHSAPITEAQTLPLHFDLSDSKNNAKPDSPFSAASDNAAADADDATRSTASSNPVPTPALPQHAQLAPQTAAPAAAAPATISGATPAQLSSIASVQAPNLPAQQLPESTATTLSTAAPVALPTPDINALALNIASKSLDGARQFDIRLDPVELGRVDVKLALDGNGNAQAHLAAERPETLALLQNNASALTRALQDSGVQVASNGLQFSLKGQERQADGQQRAPSRNRSSAISGIAAASAMTGASSSYGLSPSGEGVNILV